ncbi:MAG: hypothetical protein ACJ8GN_18525 [Longimicrobiaceae bacterium]
MSQTAAEPVGFITVETGSKDLIVSFVVELDDEGDVASLILMRTPFYEPLRPPEDWGVSVWHELYPEIENERLRRLRLMSSNLVEITTTERRYLLDVSRVDPDELRDARKVLRRMNFDHAFELDFDL